MRWNGSLRPRRPEPIGTRIRPTSGPDRARARLDPLEAPPLALICGVDAQKAAVAENVVRLARGAAAHDMLLWGARGMGNRRWCALRSGRRRMRTRAGSRSVQAAPDEGLTGLLTGSSAIRPPVPDPAR